jgi:hypothetical protein
VLAQTSGYKWGVRVRPDQAIQSRESARVKMPGRSREQNNGLSCGRCPPLQFIPPTPCESRWRNKPSEVSFDSRRGATLETFSSRNEHSGPGARDERSCAAGQVSDARGKPLCGLPLSPTVRATVAIVPGLGTSERKSFGSRLSGHAESCRCSVSNDYTRRARGKFSPECPNSGAIRMLAQPDSQECRCPRS